MNDIAVGQPASERQLDREQTLPPSLVAHDTSVELWREYQYLVGDKFVNYRIKLPAKVFVKHTGDGDSHRVVDAEGVTHYMKAGWLVFRWASKTAPSPSNSEEA